MSSRILRIGQVAAEAGVSPDTLRYYERMGLLTNVSRSYSGYREYSPEAVNQVRFIRNALRFGFGLQEVAKFLQGCKAGHPPCRQVRAAAEKILMRVDKQIKELQITRRAIRATLADWDVRLSKTPQGMPAHLLQAIRADQIPTDTLSVRLRRSKQI